MKNSLTKKTPSIFALIKSLFIAILITLICILIFAFILNIFNLGNESIDIVNQIIKIISIVIGLTFLKKFTHNSVISFIIFGTLYTVFTFLIFSALNQSFYIDITLFNDTFFATLTSCIYFFLFAKKNKQL